MQFNSVSIDSIKSPAQRELLSLWDNLAAGRAFPSFFKLKPRRETFDADQAVIWSVEYGARGKQFRALYSGAGVGEAFNLAFAGKTMDEVIPESLRKLAIDAADACATSGRAIYTILRTTDAAGARIDCARLLLPFGGAVVEQVLSLLELSSAAPLQRRRVVENFRSRAEMIFAGSIGSSPSKAGAAATAPEATGPGTGEHRKAARRKVTKAGKIAFGRANLTCVVRDLSRTGAAIEVPNPASLPDKFKLILEMESASRPCVVVWRKARRVGVRFDHAMA
jgi:hypothetical protein